MVPIRILHVVGRLERGGIEVWLMNVLRNIDRKRYQFDFLAHTQSPSAFDEEAQQLGARILRQLPPRRAPFSYSRKLAENLRANGPYDVIHSHAHFFSGVVLRTAAKYGVPIRIAHSHNDTRRLDAQAGFARRRYLSITRNRIQKFATCGLACSSFAAASLFGEDWQEDPRWKVLHYGIDFSPLAAEVECNSLRNDLGIPIDRPIIGQVARLDPQKNHRFTLEVFKAVLNEEPNAHLLLVGGGYLRQEIESLIAQNGLAERVLLAGDQAQIGPFLALMNCMIFPSTHEGLGIVALEAQAAGVPVLASDRVPRDVDVLPGMVEFLPLEAPLSRWCQSLRQLLARPRENPKLTKASMQASDFGIQTCLRKLASIYEGDSSAWLSALPEQANLSE